jgi:hypothetical protein
MPMRLRAWLLTLTVAALLVMTTALPALASIFPYH